MGRWGGEVSEGESEGGAGAKRDCECCRAEKTGHLGNARDVGARSRLDRNESSIGRQC